MPYPLVHSVECIVWELFQPKIRIPGFRPRESRYEDCVRRILLGACHFAAGDLCASAKHASVTKLGANHRQGRPRL